MGQRQELLPPHEHVALIVGISGMVGVTLAEALKSPMAPVGLWQVYGASRQSLPSWFPSQAIDHHIRFDATDQRDTLEKISQVSHIITHLFWLAINVSSTEEANKVVNTAMLNNVLDALTRHHNSPLLHVCVQTGTKHYMGPIFDPLLGTKLMYIPPTPFVEDSPRLEFPNFYYALEDLVASYSPAFTYSIHRYPGTRYTWDNFCDLSDARVLAEQQIWAAVVAGEKAKNQAFNCTNGDVFTWKRLWGELCDIFHLKFVPFDDNAQEFDWAEEMKDKEKLWDFIVEKHGLYKTKWDEFANFKSLQVVLSFKFQHVCSMNKSKDHGFLGYANTLNSLRFWVERLRFMKIIP